MGGGINVRDLSRVRRRGLPTCGPARGLLCASAALALACVGAKPAHAQSGAVERTLERMGRMVEGAMARVGGGWNRSREDYQVASRQEAPGFRWSGQVPAGGSLEIKGVNGAIFAELAEGPEAVVTTEVRGRRSDPGSVRIEVVEHDGGLTLCAVYPSPEGDRENVCAPGSGGRMNTRRNDVEVEFHVRVPAGVPFVARTVNGEVEALDLEGDVTAVTVNGDIDVTTSGVAEAETVNGSIDVAMQAVPAAQGLSFSTVNGSIRLDLPNDVDAELDARWLNGELESDLPIMLSGRMGRRAARGTLGDGGPLLDVSTVNGSIRIR